MSKSFCFFFQKEALSFFLLARGPTRTISRAAPAYGAMHPEKPKYGSGATLGDHI
jgi:hypothetical protein